jgi:Alpha-L-arabinofuranosidase
MAMQGWTDEFDGAQLNGRWRWHAPAGGSYALQDGWLVLSAPQREKGFNHWSGVFDAPMLLTDLPDGDWAAETTLHLSDFASDGDFHIGMAIAVSERYLWLWGIFYSATTWKMTKPELWLERTGEARLLQVPLETRTVQLRAEKRGMWLHFFWRHNERMPWQEAGKSLAWFTPKQIGLIVKTWGNGRPLTARFDRFRLEAMPAKDEPIKVSVRVNPQKRLNEISPLIYGQFIEHLGRCIYGGIWAEMLRNRKMHGSVQENGVVENWQPFGKNARWFADNVEFFVGGQSQVIEGTGSGEHGIRPKWLGFAAQRLCRACDRERRRR